METLAYLHLALAHETPTDIARSEPLDWRKFSSQAWMCLLPMIVSFGVLGMASETLAQTFRQGDRSPEITVIQERLRDLGYFNQSPSGNFGSATRNAVIRFQQETGLVPDGVVGRQTIAELFRSQRRVRVETLNPPPLATPFPPDFSTEEDPQTFTTAARTTVLRRGDRNPEVRRLQERLRREGFYFGPIDGIFGGQTERAVRQFQTDKGLFPDGVAGSETLAALRILPADEENRYVVVVPVLDENTLSEVRAIPGFANATLGESRRGSYVSAGSFPNRASAESRSFQLRSRGLDARVAYLP